MTPQETLATAVGHESRKPLWPQRHEPAGKVVQQLLKAKGLTQEGAARKAGVRLGFLAEIIHNRRILDSKLANRLARKWDFSEEEAHRLSEVSVPVSGVRRKTVAVQLGTAPARLGEFIRQKRRALGMTGRDLAMKCGLKSQRLVIIEQGKVVPSPLTAANLASALTLSRVECAEYFRRFALALEFHGDVCSSITAPAMIAAIEWAMLDHDPRIGASATVDVAPTTGEIRDLKGAISRLQAEFRRLADAGINDLAVSDPATPDQ